ncbi:MAG TPA: hypothetical protein HPP94_08365 [Desulfuromonadales bacterium]|nr:hypothetical protein [Desulfuromonadales bacterium]
MAVVNHSKKEINAKIVYFGPAESAKNDALQFIYARIKPALRGELRHVPAGGDSLLLFDFTPFDAPLADGYRVRLHVYTLSGPVVNPATWKMTLKGCDGIVLLMDADPERLAEARASVAQLRELLSAYGVSLSDSAAVLQIDNTGSETSVPDVTRLAAELDLSWMPACTSRTSSGQGVLEALSTLSRLVLDRIRLDLATVEHAEPPAETDGLEPETPELQAQRVFETQLSSPVVETVLEETECRPRLVIASPELNDSGTVIRIPLELICGSVSRRLVVSVAVTADTIDLYTP